MSNRFHSRLQSSRLTASWIFWNEHGDVLNANRIFLKSVLYLFSTFWRYYKRKMCTWNLQEIWIQKGVSSLWVTSMFHSKQNKRWTKIELTSRYIYLRENNTYVIGTSEANSLTPTLCLNVPFKTSRLTQICTQANKARTSKRRDIYEWLTIDMLMCRVWIQRMPWLSLDSGDLKANIQVSPIALLHV